MLRYIKSHGLVDRPQVDCQETMLQPTKKDILKLLLLLSHRELSCLILIETHSIAKIQE